MKRFIIFMFIITPAIIYADIGDWTTYTNKSNIRDLALFENSLWCVTNGGVFKYDSIDSTYEIFTNTNGLSSIDVKTLEIDNYGNVWFGMRNGYINVYQKSSQSWEAIDDIIEDKEHEIFDLALYGDSLFIALDIGISLYHHIYNKDKREVKETYKNLGTGFQVEIPVKNIYIKGRDIWAGTDYGIAKSNLNFNNLLDPKFWTNYTTSNSNLISNTIRSISSLDDTIFVATDQGINKFDGTNWQTINNGLYSKDVSALVQKAGNIYAATRVGIFQYNRNQWIMVGATVNNVTSLAIADNGDIWAGQSKTYNSEGFSHYKLSHGTWYHLIPPGPAGNNFKSLAIDHDGVLWCCSTTDGIFRFDGTQWKNYKSNEYGFRGDNFWAVAVDHSNRKWFGSWGGGVVRIDANDSLTVFTDELGGIDVDPDYIVITNLTVDANNNVWFLNYGAANANIVAVTTPEGQWQHFSTSDGIITNNYKELYGISVDQYNRTWIGSVSGVTVIDYNNTLFDKYDDDLTGTLTTTDGLVSNNVRTIAEDYDGIMWLGTDLGINYWYKGSVYDKSGVIHDNIQVIAVDIRNNKWFGTMAGVSVLSADNYRWTHYTTENSPLVSLNVTSFAFDESTGKVYIGTTNGLSCLETPYIKPQMTLEHVTAGPNPFIIGNGTKFTLYKLADNVSIKFLATNGLLIRNVSKDEIQGFYEWDGKNDKGEYIASGIYLYIIFNEDTGLSKVGKVAVIKG